MSINFLILKYTLGWSCRRTTQEYIFQRNLLSVGWMGGLEKIKIMQQLID